MIDNYSAKELELMFDKHIVKNVKIIIYKWKDYRSLFKIYNIIQIETFT